MYPDKNHIRLRNNPKIKPLNIPKDQIDTINKILLDPRYTSIFKKNKIKKIVRPCCLCQGIPSVQLSYKVEIVRVIEYYCTTCIEKVFTRESLEPENKEDIPAYYNCIKLDN